MARRIGASYRKLANALGISKDVVYRVWREGGVKPHRLERYMGSNDPGFRKESCGYPALDLNLPQHATVFCADEKGAFQTRASGVCSSRPRSRSPVSVHSSAQTCS